MPPRHAARRAPQLVLAFSLASGMLLRSGLAAADPPAGPPLIPQAKAAAAPVAAPPPPDEPVELKTRSPEMVVGGFFLGLSGTAMLVGGLTYASTPGADTKGLAIGGVVGGVGAAALAGGLALVMIGAKQVPSSSGARALPAVRVGAGSTTMTWAF